MFFPKKVSVLLLCATIVSCASSPSPEDVQMSNALSAQGKTLLAEGKNAEARDIYLSALSRDEDNLRAWNGLGVSYDLLGKREKAKDAYEHAYDLAPRDMTAANNLAHLYIEEGKFEEAARMLEPLAADKAAPDALKQNLAKAEKMAQAKETVNEGTYADLGAFPTYGLAEGMGTKAKAAVSNADELSFLIVPEVKVGGGTPLFTIKVVGRDPQSICNELNRKAFPCIAYEKH